MYIKRKFLALSGKNCCSGKATIRSFCIADFYRAVGNTKMLSSDVETQRESLSIFVLQSTTYKLLCLDVNCPNRF